MNLTISENIFNIILELTTERPTKTENVARDMTFKQYFEYNNPNQSVYPKFDNFKCMPISYYELDQSIGNVEKFKRFVWMDSDRVVAFLHQPSKELYISNELSSFERIVSLRGDVSLEDISKEGGIRVKRVKNILAKIIDLYIPSPDLTEYKLIAQKQIDGLLFKMYFSEEEEVYRLEVRYNGYIVTSCVAEKDDNTIGTRVACDFQNYGLGKWAASEFRKIVEVKSNFQSEVGFKLLQKIWMDEVRQALSSGYYDYAIRNRKLSKQAVVQILRWFKTFKLEGLGYDKYLRISKRISV